jgi:hypothetical protein
MANIGVQQGASGKQVGQVPVASAGEFGDVLVSELQPRFYEWNYRGLLYHLAGSSNTALVAANAIATGVTATAQPVVGLWNPPTSGVNLIPLKLKLSLTTVANTAVSPGGFMWLVSSGQNAISTGALGVNGKSLVQSGGQGKGFSITTALTGLVGSLTTVQASSVQTINAAGPATAIHQPVFPSEEYIEGKFIIPPGGVLALMNQVSTTTVNYSTGLIWLEIPV